MTEEEREKAKVAAVASVGAGVGSAGGATVGVLELAARGAARVIEGEGTDMPMRQRGNTLFSG